jgi:FtsZ-interacting cell division protein ZipA
VVAELRVILAVLSAVLLAGIWWWGARRSRQAAGNSELRESTVGTVTLPVEADLTLPRGREDASEWDVSPLEPLSIRTAHFEAVPLGDLPMMAHADPLDQTLDLGLPDPPPVAVNPPVAVDPPAAARSFERPPSQSRRLSVEAANPAPRAPEPPVLEPPVHEPPVLEPPVLEAPVLGPPTSAPAPPAAAAAKAAVTNSAETQRIVSIRVCAAGETRWSGVELMAAFEHHGLAHGRYNVFHRKHSDGRTLFCAASLVEPGVFNLSKMAQEEFRGLTLFAVLPGPLEPLQTLDAVVETAGALAETLHGSLQDSHGAPLSAQRAEALRDDVARFQASLTMT